MNDGTYNYPSNKPSQQTAVCCDGSTPDTFAGIACAAYIGDLAFRQAGM